MSGVPYIRLFVDDWLSGTQDLSLEERGVLATIVALTGALGEPPREDYNRLTRRLSCTAGKAKRIIQTLVDEGSLERIDGRLVSKRAQKETKISQKMSQNGTRAATERWAKSEGKSNKNNGTNDAPAYAAVSDPHMRNGCQPEPEPYRGDTPLTPPKRVKAGKAKPACRIPDEYRPDLDWAVSEGLTLQAAEREAVIFRDYWSAASGQNSRKADWPATWRNWVRRKIDSAPANVTPLHRNQGTSYAGEFNNRVDAALDFRLGDGRG